jgi:hypothetical protein
VIFEESEMKDEITWVTAGPYRVMLNRTSEGLYVDVYTTGLKEPVATAYVFDDEIQGE